MSRGIGDEVAAPRTDLEVDDVAVAACGVQEHAGRIASDRRQHAENRKPARTRRTHKVRERRRRQPITRRVDYRCMAPISRHEFLQRTAMAGAACPVVIG